MTLIELQQCSKCDGNTGVVQKFHKKAYKRTYNKNNLSQKLNLIGHTHINIITKKPNLIGHMHINIIYLILQSKQNYKMM